MRNGDWYKKEKIVVLHKQDYKEYPDSYFDP